jgi:biotin carboxyl carrier protein
MTQAPRKRVKVIVNGKPYVVEVGELTASPLTVTVNGQPYVVMIEMIESDAGAPAQIAALEKVARPTSAPEKVPVPTGPAGPAITQVKAPMPGNILDISVKPGDTVRFGQPLCALEAMKMKSAIRSPRDGVIASVQVTPGQAVAYGDVLFTYE